jgi:uncharacterized protein (TIGR02611 family)
MTQENEKQENTRPEPRGGLLHLTLRQARKLIVAVIGGTVVLVGVIMFFTPGPAMVLIPLGLAILATEFIWARRLLKRIKQNADTAINYLKKSPKTSDKDTHE